MSIYDDLLKGVEDLPKGAVERTKKDITRKGYDTTGYQYQFLVNVMNEVIGFDKWSFDYTLVKDIEGKYNNGKPWWDITVDVIITVSLNGEKVITRKCAGGHRSEMYADALKGAITNGFKKTVALFGVGKKAYEGTIDEDYRPLAGDMQSASKTVSFKTPAKSSDSKPPKTPEKTENKPSGVFKVANKPCDREHYIEVIQKHADKAGIDIKTVKTLSKIDNEIEAMSDAEVLKIGATLASAIKSLNEEE